MAYVDLNPIRAGMAKSLQTSDFTAVQARINETLGKNAPLPLLQFEDQLDATREPLPYYLAHYLELADWTGRAVRDDKRGSLPEELEPILDTLGFDEESWLAGFKLFRQPLFQAIGPVDQIRKAAQANQRSWYRGTSACQIVFGPP
jgi:hypothetical protein